MLVSNPGVNSLDLRPIAVYTYYNNAQKMRVNDTPHPTKIFINPTHH